MARLAQQIPQVLNTDLPEQWVVLTSLNQSGQCKGYMWTINPLTGTGPQGRNNFNGFYDQTVIYHTIDPITAMMRGLIEPNELDAHEGIKAWLIILKGNKT